MEDYEETSIRTGVVKVTICCDWLESERTGRRQNTQTLERLVEDKRFKMVTAARKHVYG